MRSSVCIGSNLLNIPRPIVITSFKHISETSEGERVVWGRISKHGILRSEAPCLKFIENLHSQDAGKQKSEAVAKRKSHFEQAGIKGTVGKGTGTNSSRWGLCL